MASGPGWLQQELKVSNAEDGSLQQSDDKHVWDDSVLQNIK